jgi:hypothetical protein
MRRAKAEGETSVAVAPGSPPVSGEASLAALTALERRMEVRMEEQLWLVHQMVASIEIMLVDGYFVKLWADPETERWIADCPTVKAVVEYASRDEVVAAIPEAMADMLEVLTEMGVPLPPKDV